MKKRHASRSGFFGLRMLLGFALGLIGILLVLVGFGISSGPSALAQNPSAVRSKISPEVLTDTADNKNASVVIFLGDQADVSAAYGMSPANVILVFFVGVLRVDNEDVGIF